KDGTCLWRAAAQVAYGSDSNQVADLLRHVSLETLRLNPDLFRDDSESVDQHIEKHSSYKEWGGYLDLIAISLALSVKFSVYQYNRATGTVYREPAHHKSLEEREVEVVKSKLMELQTGTSGKQKHPFDSIQAKVVELVDKQMRLVRDNLGGRCVAEVVSGEVAAFAANITAREDAQRVLDEAYAWAVEDLPSRVDARVLMFDDLLNRCVSWMDGRHVEGLSQAYLEHLGNPSITHTRTNCGASRHIRDGTADFNVQVQWVILRFTAAIDRPNKTVQINHEEEEEPRSSVRF
ncbi:hypothetical protein B484DRAFT_407892, partial [Ochromonadaceae sp. CCMP2298]